MEDRIIEIAEEKGLPIEKREDLTEVLFTLDAGSFIPKGLYEVIAQLYVTIPDVQDKT